MKPVAVQIVLHTELLHVEGDPLLKSKGKTHD